MIRVTVLWPKTSESHFDMDYYLSKHVPMTKARLQSMGFPVEAEVDEGLGVLRPESLLLMLPLDTCFLKKWKTSKMDWLRMARRSWLIFLISPMSNHRFRLGALFLVLSIKTNQIILFNTYHKTP